ncbi:amidase family protein [Nocardia otitidiscaviarum]|uniref:amidase family protein n=1 Tax=Nocardia otitidiscaviarum TaxID=1823 RepID=UPI001E44F30A|nr:amidase family protein [Nocardia otitidiscaviarum]
MAWSFLSAEQLSAALRAGAVTSVELTEEAIARIEHEDKVINAICVPDFDRARAAASHADRALARGEDGPLLGIPVTVKESYDMAGLGPHRHCRPTSISPWPVRWRAQPAISRCCST